MATGLITIHQFALREIRQRTGISVVDAAGQAGLSSSYWRSLENGSRREVSEVTYKAILGALALTDYRTLLANPYAAAAATDDVATAVTAVS
jgi:transcriptional regulator with XRE-family HTH domain